MTDTLPEMWWPSPSAFDDLTVEDAEHGFDLLAPDDTECGEWLAFWNQDEAHHTVFEKNFVEVLRNYANKVLETHGKDEDLPDGENSHSVQTENVGTGSQP
jgi:hypothetical protein